MKTAFRILTVHKFKMVVTVIALFSGVYFFINRDVEQSVHIDPEAIRPAEGFDTYYYHVNRNLDADKPQNVRLTIPADTFHDETIGVQDYDGPVFHMTRNEAVKIDVFVEESGVYHLALDQKDVGHSILPTSLRVRINGDVPFEEARTIELPTRWVFSSDDFIEDRYGNEIMPGAIKDDGFEKSYLHDATGLNAKPLMFYLDAGDNTIEIRLVNGEITMGNFYVESVKDYPDYDSYVSQYQNASLIENQPLIIGAEQIAYKTNPSIRLQSERDPSATSYNTRYLRLNAIDGQSFRNGNDVVAYEIDVPETGFYHVGFKYKQNFLMQMPVFREIRINGEVPFKEVAMVPFHHTNTYQYMLVGNEEAPFMFYLEEGKNVLSLRVVVEPYRNAYENIVMVMDEMTDLSLEIKKLTGNTTDRYRTWRLEMYIPDIEERFDRWIEVLEHVEEELGKYSPITEPTELKNLQLAIKQLDLLREDVNDIPNRMRMLADGDSSTAQLLGVSIQSFLLNGLTFEQIYIGSASEIPSERANVFTRSFESVKRFFLSFRQDDYAATGTDDDVVEIWVNYPRQYLEIMQQIIDSEFTPETGIKVQLSLMPDENKLILANAAGTAPDIALGVNHWIPYEFAIRNASLDLRQFEGYSDTVSQFAPGVMVPYAFEDGMYGMPLTQNFWVTFYRTDIMDALDIEAPDTWDEVIEVLPELQRYGMNYYEPLAFFGGFKPFVATMPFIYQLGGELYAEDGMSTLINSDETLEGIRLMTDLFTVYNMPKEVPNFYNHFRFGTMPIGISDLSTYLQLTIAAPEIAGKWDIAPHPGVMNEHGEVERWAASGAQASVILSATDKPDESWEFLSWWMSTPIQVMFANRLQTTFGAEFLWNTANLEAFAQLPLPQDHIDVILAQWEFALEASRIPGAYMVEREISNAWNKIVFDDANPRIALDNAVRVSNREILYRMQEFGYVENGVVIKPYRVPTMRNIDYWLRGHHDD